jgi:hypothetical protein
VSLVVILSAGALRAELFNLSFVVPDQPLPAACAFAFQPALSHPFNSIDISSSLLQAKI